MAKKSKSAKRDKPRERKERRFDARSTIGPALPYGLGAVGAAAMGAGVWGVFGAALTGAAVGVPAAPYILSAGAILAGAAIWIGTSGEPPLRVGDGGVAIDKGGLRRVPWYGVERIEWRGEAVRVIGKDDAGAPVTIVAKLASHAQAGAWIVKEARERVPSAVDVPTDATLPPPASDAGTVLVLDAPQVVGKHCACSGKVISFEPDARLCPRCERVYHKDHVPETCACGYAFTPAA
jgi:hypothetical protein